MHEQFREAMRIIGVTPLLTVEYEAILPVAEVDYIGSLTTSPNRLVDIREALYSRIDSVTKTAIEDAES